MIAFKKAYIDFVFEIFVKSVIFFNVRETSNRWPDECCSTVETRCHVVICSEYKIDSVAHRSCNEFDVFFSIDFLIKDRDFINFFLPSFQTQNLLDDIMTTALKNTGTYQSNKHIVAKLL